MRLFTIAVILLVCSVSKLSAQNIAFPGAEGCGKFTTGGRGSQALAPQIFVVNTLNDANVPGTFRYAVTKSLTPSTKPRIVIFTVAGTIHLNSAITLNKSNTTIAGQTAPGQGICLADYTVSIGADNMIIRYLRFRLGDKNENLGMVNGSGNDDAFGGNGRKNIIVDHCTMSWSDDETMSIYRGDSTTLQWNFMEEPLNYSYHFETGDADYEHHGYGGIQGGQHTTIHHNLYAHCQGRAPRFDGSRNLGDGATPGLENVDFRNNVIYDWGSYNVNGGEGGNYNVVNNYYKYGPSTSTSSTRGVAIKYMVINPFTQSSPFLPYGKYYLTGNYVDGSATITNANWRGAAMASTSLNDTTGSKVTVPFNLLAINMETADNAFNSVLSKAGASLPGRDTLDQRIVGNVINRTGKIIDVQGGYPHGTAYALTVNAWPTLDPGFAPVDTDGDGLPDVWEVQRGLNPANKADSNGYIASNGLSNIENFINGDTIVAKGITNTCVVAKGFTSSNTGLWAYANDNSFSAYNSPSYLVSADSMNVVSAVLDNGAYGSFSSSFYTTSTTRIAPNGHPYLNRNITLVPGNSALITSPVSVRLFFTKAEFNALKASDPTVTSLADLRVVLSATNTCVNAITSAATVFTPTAYGTYDTYQTGYYVEFTTSDFGTFFIAGATAAPLPVTLLSFTGTKKDGAASLTWTTSNEIDVKEFVLERSTTGESFVALGSVVAKGPNTLNSYAYTDKNLPTGNLFYRLRVANKNGTFTYSNVVLINNRDKGGINVNPNPATSNIVVTFPKLASGAAYKIVAADGRTVAEGTISKGADIVKLNVAQLSKGIYQLQLVTPEKDMAVKFVKQ